MNDSLLNYRGCCIDQDDIAGLDLSGCQIANEPISGCNTFADEYVNLLNQVSLRLILWS
jgi:hypothetical protein